MNNDTTHKLTRYLHEHVSDHGGKGDTCQMCHDDAERIILLLNPEFKLANIRGKIKGIKEAGERANAIFGKPDAPSHY